MCKTSYIFIYSYLVYMKVLPNVCMCITCVVGTHRNQKRVLKLLELEL